VRRLDQSRCLRIGGGERRRSFERLVLVRSVQQVRAAADYDTAIACRIEAIHVTIAAIATTRSGCLRKWESCMARAPGGVGASIVINRLAYCYRRNRHSLERAYFKRLNKAPFMPFHRRFCRDPRWAFKPSSGEDVAIRGLRPPARSDHLDLVAVAVAIGESALARQPSGDS
jgi:hypothetical protein